MSRPLLLDLFCGAGGTAMGYYRAGFDVFGVDIVEQPNYPFEFLRADAAGADVTLQIFAVTGGFSAIHASPPCQAHLKGLRAVNQALGRTDEHSDLIGRTRQFLREMGLPYVIENVVGAPLVNPIQLCGSSFGLPIRRHRLFESNVMLLGRECEHDREGKKRFWTSFRKGNNSRRSAVVQVYGSGGEKHEWGPALGIDWMTYAELAQAIPPAYTEHIGHQLIQHVQKAVA